MEIHSESTFSNLEMFENENDMEDEVEDDLLCDESITTQSCSKESSKADYSYDPPKRSLTHDYTDSMKKLVLTPNTERIAQGKIGLHQALIP